MQNSYKIEGNINFYEELNKTEDDDTKNENVCLITREKLTNYYVELKCGHKFNYIPLYKDLLNLKKNSNKPFYDKTQLRCPYCRKNNELLPYYPELKLSKILGINAYKEPPINLIHQIYCQYNSVDCTNIGAPMILNNETKYLCLCHYNQLIKEEKDAEKKRLKEEKDAEKKRLKEEKDAGKKRLKEEKEAEKTRLRREKEEKKQKKIKQCMNDVNKITEDLHPS